MAVTTNLAASVREERGKSAMRKLRASGRIPAVLYGHGEDTHAISLDAHEIADGRVAEAEVNVQAVLALESVAAGDFAHLPERLPIDRRLHAHLSSRPLSHWVPTGLIMSLSFSRVVTQFSSHFELDFAF